MDTAVPRLRWMRSSGLTHFTEELVLGASLLASGFAAYAAMFEAWAQRAAIHGTDGFSYGWIAARWANGEFWGGLNSHWSPLFPAIAAVLHRAGLSLAESFALVNMTG